MKLEDQVTNLELSKKLKKLGVKQESMFYWSKPISDNGQPNGGYFVNWKESPDFCDDDSHDHKLVSAFTVAELGEMLPEFIYSHRENAGWYCEIRSEVNRKQDIGFFDTEANARAKLLIYLIENNLSNN